MKTRYFVLVCLLLVVLPRLTAASADELWARIGEMQKAPPPVAEREGEVAVLTAGYLEELARRGHALSDVLLDFIERYPADDRHWDAVAALTKVYRPVFKEIGEVRTKGWDAVVEDPVARQKWDERVDAFVQQMLVAPRVPLADLQAGYEYWVNAARVAVDEPVADKSAVLAEFRHRIDVTVAKLPDFSRRLRFEMQYLNRLRSVQPAAVDMHLAKLAQDPDANIAAWVTGEQAVAKLRREPMELAFTAIDGRAVDVAKLRGKVVLVDFWATWCGPCVNELPNVVANYEKYHDRGFEVVAISLDKPADRRKLMDFIARKKLPWPQYFDGEHPRNDVAAKYSVMAIPAMFLLDQNGLLVTTNARGEVLEREIKRLLKL